MMRLESIGLDRNERKNEGGRNEEEHVAHFDASAANVGNVAQGQELLGQDTRQVSSEVRLARLLGEVFAFFPGGRVGCAARPHWLKVVGDRFPSLLEAVLNGFKFGLGRTNLLCLVVGYDLRSILGVSQRGSQ